MVTLHGKDYEWQLCGVCGSREIVTHKPRGEPDVAIVLQMVNLMHKRCYVTHKPRAHYFKITSSFGSVPFWMLVLISSAISPTLTMLQAHQINHLAEVMFLTMLQAHLNNLPAEGDMEFYVKKEALVAAYLCWTTT
ncbi:hypothetical protein ACSQ67_021353 [Phaseolus vulgaris]